MKQKEEVKGFTLIEFIAVVAVISILVAILYPQFISSIEKSRISRLETDYFAIKNAIGLYYDHTNSFPAYFTASPSGGYLLGCTTNRDGYFDLITNPGLSGWKGPYIDKTDNINPFGGTYAITCSATTGNCGELLNPPGSPQNYRQVFCAFSVRSNFATKIDSDLDDGVTTTGIVRYSGTANRLEMGIGRR